MARTITIDEELLELAREALGTDDPRATVEASLRQTIHLKASPVELPLRIRSDAELEQFLRDARRPRTQAELDRRRADAQTMDRLRVKVGHDFDIARELRVMRHQVEAG